MDEICRAVVDTSVLVAAVLGPTGASREVLRRGLDLEFIWLVSDPILKEYRKVLRSDRISEQIKIPAKVLKSLDLLLEGLKRGVTMKLRAVRDQTDDIFVECAAEHHADLIVSLDEDLLTLKNFGPVRIIRPKEFLDILRR